MRMFSQIPNLIKSIRLRSNVSIDDYHKCQMSNNSATIKAAYTDITIKRGEYRNRECEGGAKRAASASAGGGSQNYSGTFALHSVCVFTCIHSFTLDWALSGLVDSLRVEEARRGTRRDEARRVGFIYSLVWGFP